MEKNNLKRKKTDNKNALILENEQKLEDLKKSLENFTAYAYVQPNPMWSGIYENKEESKKIIDLTLSTLHELLCDEKKRDKIIDRVLSEIILGAYQDRLVAYTIAPTGVDKNSTEAMEMIQGIRQKADLHLIRAIQVFKEIKRPPVTVVVRQADQVNVGEKQMNVDKQVNISSDLDKK